MTQSFLSATKTLLENSHDFSDVEIDFYLKMWVENLQSQSGLEIKGIVQNNPQCYAETRIGILTMIEYVYFRLIKNMGYKKNIVYTNKLEGSE